MRERTIMDLQKVGSELVGPSCRLPRFRGLLFYPICQVSSVAADWSQIPMYEGLTLRLLSGGKARVTTGWKRRVTAWAIAPREDAPTILKEERRHRLRTKSCQLPVAPRDHWPWGG